MLAPDVNSTALELSRGSRIDAVRVAMEAEVQQTRQKCQTYLNWYSPAYNTALGTHDAWLDPIKTSETDMTRDNFPIARACVDIWTALEASKPPIVRAEPHRMIPPPPSFDQAEELRLRQVYGAFKKYHGALATARGATIRDWMRRDSMALKGYIAHRRKNLYGFSWMKVWPDHQRQQPRSHVLRNPATVYPIWSDRDPGETEMILVAYQISARKAVAKYGLGLDLNKNGMVVLGRDSGEYRELNERWYDQSRTMVWVEELWWRTHKYGTQGSDRGRIVESRVECVTRVAGTEVSYQAYPDWRLLPWVYFENTDERDAYGWSDIASVIDINDEFNRRVSQQGDIIGNYSAPRFQLLGSFMGRDVEMPAPFELISLADQERIEQILTRIDVFPAQAHFTVLTDLLHRVSGLPPIVWGLIANAQTSGRALSASWKATEARLSPKLMRNERSYTDWLELALQYDDVYNWNGELFFHERTGEPFRDFVWDFPPMEPRDFLEVTQNEITKRDAGFTSTLKGIRAIGDEAAEDTLEEVMAEKLNIFLHPSETQAFLLAQRAELDNLAYAQQLGVSLGPGGGPGRGTELSPATVAETVGLARDAQAAGAAPVAGATPGSLPPTQAGAPANAGQPPVSTGTLMRQGGISNQFLQQGQLGVPPQQ